jgi:NADPH:quinone reductase-like Zn-dependent oxidoreductase
MGIKLPVEGANQSHNLRFMHALVIHQESLHLKERPDPVPAQNEVLVATNVAGINAADLLQRRGFYPAPPGWPVDVPGMELSGRVSSVGANVDPELVSRRVCAIVGGGAQATRCIVPVAHLIDVPVNVGMDQAGGFPEAFITAYDALVLQGKLRSGERLLISGASGGVGSAAVQIGHLLGAHVTAVTRTLEHHQELMDLGADEVISLEEVSSLAPVNVVLELVGAAHLSLAQNRLAPFARIVVIGVAGGGSKVEINLINVMGTRSTLTGSTLRSRTNQEKAEVIRHVAEALTGPWGNGELRVPIAATFLLANADDAYASFAQPGKFGKVLLLMPGDTT